MASSSSHLFLFALILAVTFCNMENGMAARQLLQLPKPTALPPMPTIPSLPQPTLPQPTLPSGGGLPPLPSGAMPTLPSGGLPPLPSAGAIPTLPTIPSIIPKVSLPPLPSGFPTMPSIPGLTPSGPGN
ncbi:unnamed protein product [Linum trigynum]|uniref:Uncharacterized protein n=1 Tax=Linum trigynum TaxID=586398 RepID=A0AAV2F519_9ROSI